MNNPEKTDNIGYTRRIQTKHTHTKHSMCWSSLCASIHE